MVELLAPAGSMEALYAAVNEGANAVYLAGNRFGARAYAKNFDEDELKKGIKYAHLHNVAVHVTVNTIAEDSEFEDLGRYLRFLEEVGADAVLVQDLGVAALAKEVAPRLPLHASTQMTVHSLDGVRALEELGFVRVVLSRELSLEEIKYIAANSKAEIEVFMHGALCVCYSGMCLMSSMIGGRSGNRGRCAQPCRLPYELTDEKGIDVLKGKAGNYLSSPRDLATVEMLPELINTGVASFKIEGRMKRPEYVATVVRVYRKAIDSFYKGNFFIADEDKEDLRQIFNRDFTTAYLKGYPGKNMMSDKRPNNRGVMVGRVVKAETGKIALKLAVDLRKGDIIEFWVKVGGRVTAELNELFDKKGEKVEEICAGEIAIIKVEGKISENDRAFKVFDIRLTERAKAAYESAKRIEIEGRATAKVGERLAVEFIDDMGNIGKAETEFVGEAARKRPLTEAYLHQQIDRLGETSFMLKNFTAEIEGAVMVPASEINDARRRAIDALEKARTKSFNLPVRVNLLDKPAAIVKNNDIRENKLLVRVDTLEKVRAAVESGADGIIFGSESYGHFAISIDEYEKTLLFVRKNGKDIFFTTPRIIRDGEGENFKNLLHGFERLKPSGIYVHTIGAFYRVKEETTLPIFTDFSLITYNEKTLESLRNYGAMGVTLSEELTLNQIKSLVKKAPLPLEIIIHGKAELMVSDYCVMGTFLGGRGEKPCSMPCKEKPFFLRDRKGEKFPIVTDEYCRMHILNGKTRSMLPHAKELSDMSLRLRIDGRYESDKDVYKIAAAYKKASLLDETAARQFEEKLFDKNEITRGHFFRGVL